MTPVRLEPAAVRSRVKHSTTEPLRSPVHFVLEIKVHTTIACMRGSRKFCQRGSNLNKFFFSLMRGGKIKIPLLAGHQRLASETQFQWRLAGGPLMVQH